MSNSIYREESLERIRAPEELDRLLVVVDRKAWITLLVVALACAGAVVWSIVGRIPVTVDGFGVMINPGNVRGIQSPATGQVVNILVREGDEVQPGTVIAEINQPEIANQLEQQQAKRSQLVSLQTLAAERDSKRRVLEATAIREERSFIDGEIAKQTTLTAKLRTQNDAFDQRQRENLQQSRTLRQRLATSFEERLQRIKKLREEGLASQELVLNLESDLANSRTQLADLEMQIRELDLQAVRNDQSFLEQENRLSDLKLKRLQLDIRAQRLEQELTANAETRVDTLREIDDAIEQLQLSIREKSQIVSTEAGRILEISVSAGQVISSGTRVGTIEVASTTKTLKTIAYFNVGDGKQVNLNDAARITPSTVKRERYGSIVGKVTGVSSFPITQEGAINVVGNSQIAQSLMQQGGAIEIEIELEADSTTPSGYKWTSQGPPLQFSPGTTATVRVLIEERSPISYVLPILRTWVMGAKDDRKPPL